MATLRSWTLFPLVLLMGCGPPPPHRLGFSSALTGAQSNLGKDVYEGALLSVEDWNAQHPQVPLELVVRDDGGDPDRALANDKEFAALGLEGLTGHATSAVVAAVLPFLAAQGLVLVTATTTSTLFSRQADPLFRVSNASDAEAEVLARYLARQGVGGTFVNIIDGSNAAYTRAWSESFADHFTSLGGTLAEATVFSASQPGLDYGALVDQALAAHPLATGLCVVAGPLDTASLSQAFRKRVPLGHIVTGTWASNPDLIQFGGRAVEGLLVAQVYDPDQRGDRHLKFVQAFQTRFGRLPSFAAVQSYEALVYWGTALSLRQGGEPMSQAFLRVKSLEGLQRTIRFDDFGDAHRRLFISTVRDGEFRTIDEIEPEE